MKELINPTIAPSLFRSMKPDKNIIRVNNSMFGKYTNKYPRTTANAVNILNNTVRNVFFSNQGEMISVSNSCSITIYEKSFL